MNKYIGQVLDSNHPFQEIPRKSLVIDDHFLSQASARNIKIGHFYQRSGNPVILASPVNCAFLIDPVQNLEGFQLRSSATYLIGLIIFKEVSSGGALRIRILQKRG